MVPIRFIIDVSEDKVEFSLEQNGISPVSSYIFAKLLVDLEQGKPILIQNLMDIMPEDDPRSTLILQHYTSMRENISRPCISPAEIFNVNRAQDLRE